MRVTVSVKDEPVVRFFESADSRLYNGLSRILGGSFQEGRSFLREAMGQPYPPSGPAGGYPAMRTGKLRDSLNISQLTRHGGFSGHYVKSMSASAPYARAVHEGGFHGWGGSPVAGRPFMSLFKKDWLSSGGDLDFVKQQIARLVTSG